VYQPTLLQGTYHSITHLITLLQGTYHSITHLISDNCLVTIQMHQMS